MAEFKTETSDQDVIECSDDENYGFIKNQMDEYCPEPSEIYSLYKSLESGDGAFLKLDWTCFGKEELTPEVSPDTQSSTDEVYIKEEPLDQLDFVFQEDIKNTNLSLTNGKRELRGSARKKTTIFKEVVSNMTRHQKLDSMCEDEKSDPE